MHASIRCVGQNRLLSQGFFVGALLALEALVGCASRGDSASSPSIVGNPSPAVVGSEDQAPAPALRGGDVWVDRIGGDNREFRIEEVQRDGTMNVSFWGSEMTTDPYLNIIVYRSLTESSADPSISDKPGLWFPFPLYPNKTWANDYSWRIIGASASSGRAEDTGKVFGWEDVTVPAGTFHCIKAEVNTRFYGKGGMADESQLTYWYAPKVNRFVRFDYHSNYEGSVAAQLVEYKPATPTP
ncbi:MAG TPA: hypothetical protein VKB29_12825 [Candidatus Binataceae bacterium]|nr:hypothetical protein [Candidatus Binataceae bacterium]